VEPFPDLSTLSNDELAALISEREREEEAISYRRRLLHGRIDILRADLVMRIRAQVEEGEFDVPGTLHTRPLFEGTGDVPPEHELDPMPDLATVSTDRLRAMIHELEREEDDVSLRRRFLHGQIDMLRAERARRARGEAGLDPEDLAGILSHGTNPPPGSA
jgi:hypothetical protein